jgi:uncharacterized protein (TIGR02271 family)
VPKEEAEYYEGEVKSGRTLVAVRADGRYSEAQRLLRQHGAYDIESREAGSAARTVAGTTSRPAADLPSTSRRTAEGDQTLQLREEELQARKETVETGQVALGKEVVEEQRTMQVPTTREEVYVERHAVERRPSDRPVGETAEQTIEVPVREEQVEVEKRPVVYEEVGVAKQQVTTTQPVSETVRREEARIEREGDVEVRGWDEAMPRYRQRWQQRYGTTGRWEESEPAYRYGWELRHRPEYRGRAWSEVESQAQRDWAARNPGTPWERARDNIREAWEQATD